MDIYNGKWTEINGIIEYAFQALPNLIPTGYIEEPSAAKDLFNLDQLIPASGTAAVSFEISYSLNQTPLSISRHSRILAASPEVLNEIVPALEL